MEASFALKPGQPVVCAGRLYDITHVDSLESVLAKDRESGEVRRLRVSELSPPEGPKTDEPPVSLVNVPEELWETARQRFKAIESLLGLKRRTAAMVEARAKEVGSSRSNLYRWLDAYEKSGLLSSLLPDPPGGPTDKKLAKEIEVIVEATIKEVYLTQRRCRIKKVYNEIKDRCKKAGLSPPHYNTVRKRIRSIPERAVIEGRYGKRRVAEKYDPIRNHYPDAKWPHAVIQIDHTQLRQNLVDDKTRKYIGKPWITVAIDVYSRMVAGFYLTLEAPSALSVGMCLAHAMLRKEVWLAQHEVTTSWPYWGRPDVVHADNGPDFRGNMLRRACDEYVIDIHWRPVKKPQYGGHIERLLGTFKRDLEHLSGTSIESLDDRGDRKPEEEAEFTLTELERLLATYITKVYHQREHKGIGTSPLKMYEFGIFGDDHTPGRGLPEVIVDEERLRINFLPYEMRTVQTYGVSLDKVFYYGNVLDRWIDSCDPEDPGEKRKFVVHRDPRDISRLYFHDPDLDEFFEIPYRNPTHPGITLWEFEAARRWVKDQGAKDIDEDTIFEGHQRMREIEENAKHETARMRRNDQRRRNARAAVKPVAAKPATTDTPAPPANIKPYEEMEVL